MELPTAAPTGAPAAKVANAMERMRDGGNACARMPSFVRRGKGSEEDASGLGGKEGGHVAHRCRYARCGADTLKAAQDVDGDLGWGEGVRAWSWREVPGEYCLVQWDTHFVQSRSLDRRSRGIECLARTRVCGRRDRRDGQRKGGGSPGRSI